MLKQLKNEAFCTLRITTTGPLLIKSGYASVSGPDMTPVLPHPVPSTIRIEMTKRARLRATDRLFTGTPLGTQVAYYPTCANRLWQGVRATNIDSNAKAKTLDLGDYSGRGAGDLVHGLRDIIQSSARSSQTELLTLS